MANNVMNMDGSFKPFRFWCQHVLPQVYDDSLSYMELLNKVITYINSFGEYLEEYTVINKIVYEGIWDITKNYKVNSVVSDNGYGYLSMQAVPAGVPITNTDYWLKIADFAGELIDLGQRVLALEAKMNTAEGNINTLQGEMSTAQSNIGALQSSMTTVQSNITALTGRMSTAETNITTNSRILSSNQIKDVESCVWIGDSYTSAGSLGEHIAQRFSTLVSNKLQLTEHNYAVGGTGYIYGSTPYTTQVQNAITDFTNNNRDFTKVKYCFVIGNRNDGDGSYGFSEYSSAVSTVFSNLSSAFPNATLVVIPGLWDAKPCKQSVIYYTSIINETAELYNNVLYFSDAWTWLTGHENEILWQNGADVHPNINGHKRIAAHILNCLNGNNFNETIHYEFVPTTVAEGVSNAHCLVRVINGIAHFEFWFKTENATLSGNIMTFSFPSLAVRNLFIMNHQYFTKVKHKAGNEFPSVSINQSITKSGDNTGSFYMNIYCYDSYNKYDTSSWNWVEFDLPYGVQTVNYQV